MSSAMSASVPRVRRALLFMPGDSARKIEKGAALGVDSIIMDLEDGVALSQKQAARDTIARALTDLNFGRTERLVRVNPVGTGFQRDDLSAVLPGRPDGIVIPKIESADEVRLVSAHVREAEERLSWPVGAIRLLAIIESARAIVDLRAIVTADDRLDALIFGAEDFAGSTGATRTPEGWEVFYARSAVVTHAAAFGLAAIDTVYTALDDPDGLRADSERALHMGYTGKLAIHPRQVETITAAFTPTDAAIEAAARLMQAYHDHQAQGTGAFALDGRMVDAPMLRAAENVLARARAAGKIST